MAATGSSVDGIHRSEPFRKLARLGYGARGIVYGIIGVFAALAATGGGGRTTDTKGALATLLEQPFGKVLLAIVALGLVGYSAWRLVQSLRDVDGHGSDAKGLAIRGGLLVSAISYAALALFAVQLLLGTGGGGSSRQDWTARLLAQPAGQWLVGAVGVAVAGAGIAQLIKGWTRRYRRHLKAPAQRMRWIDPISRYGLLARGVVFLIIGGFFMVAAYQADPSEAGGLAQALRALQQQPYGSYLLLAVALGLLAFAVYSFVEAAYRRLR